MAEFDPSKVQRVGHHHAVAYDRGYLSVGDIHKLHYEQYGNQNGKPVIFLHGGPGGSTSKQNTQFFDPTIYRVVLLDQRGAGKSTPSAELEENNSHHLASDIETLRAHLGIPKWHLVFGGSWGSALALLYAQTYPAVVGGLVLRGVFTARPSELSWSREDGGAAYIYPDAYEDFLSHLSEDERSDPLRGYYRRLTSEDYSTRREAARSWNRWDMTIGALEPSNESFAKIDDDHWSLSHAILEAHYFSHGAWLSENQLLDPRNLRRISHIPWRYDIICPPRTAWQLHKLWPGSEIFIIARAGHSASVGRGDWTRGVKMLTLLQEPGILRKLIEVCDEHAERRN